MERQTTIDFRALSAEMRRDLTRIGRLRRLVRVLLCIVYPAVLAWWGFCLFGGLFIVRADYATSVLTGQYVLIGFIVFCVLHYAFMKSLSALGRQETRVMGGIVSRLFPEARYEPEGSVDPQLLTDSRLFGPTSLGPVRSTGYGRLEIPLGDRWLSVADIGVTSAGKEDISSMNAFSVLYRYFIRPIFGTRIESTMHGFRGMFGCCRLRRSFRGYVVLLPDHLENKIGYLAQTVQGWKQRHGARLVYLEDPEFERLFAVYAEDEVEARMILTPDMMRRLTRLRLSLRRDLMLSFCGDSLYYASDMPAGFLRPGRKALDDERLLEQIYREIDFCRTVEETLK